ncbi:MAG: glycosyltransferase family 4 protein [Clostridium sp.]
MRIVYLHQYFKTNSDNGGTRSYEFAKHLVLKGHEVFLITGEEINQCEIDGIKIISTATKYNNNLGKFDRIKAFLRYALKSSFIGMKLKNIDLIYATSTPLSVGIPGIILSLFKRARFIFEVRDVWPDIPIELGYLNNFAIVKIVRVFEKFIYGRADKIVVLSDGMRDNLLKKSVKEDKIEVITNLANINLFNDISIEKSILLKKFGIESDKFVCIHPGTMGVVNDLGFILRVAEETLKVDKDITFILIGEGKEKEKLIKYQKERNLSNVYIKDGLPKKEIVKIIKSCNLGIMCVADFKILEDNSANKFFDFLAAGLPIFINYEGWQAKALKSHNAGYSFKYKEHEEMAKKIIDLKERKISFESEKIKKLAEKYSLELNVNKLSMIIEGD